MSRPAPSRRTLLSAAGVAALGAAATVAGWDTAARAWAAEPGADIVRLPPLDGMVTLQGAVPERFRGDFGHLVSAAPRAVLRPGSVRDVQQVVAFARRHRIPVAVNGQSGDLAQVGEAGLESHSSYGQANPRGGIAIDARGLSEIVSVRPGRAVVEAGVTWAQVVDAGLAAGWVPPCLTDYLHLSVGGTLSVGGIGGGVQRHGLQTDQVLELDVVTGAGELVTASPTRNRDLFEAVLAGGGQAGIIVRATLALVPVRERAHVFSLYYDDLDTYLTDQEKVMADGRFDLQVGDVERSTDGTRWRYKAELVAFADAGQTVDREALLAGLRPAADGVSVVEQSRREYAFRVDAFAGYLRATGFWGLPKPWLSVFLPASTARVFMAEAAEVLTAQDLGAGLLLFYPYRREQVRTPLAVLPDSDIGWHFDLLAFPGPGADTAAMLERNRRLYDRAVRLGGKRYLIGAVPGMTGTDWQRHYGGLWERVVRAKHRYDPAGILTPGQGIHTP
ncbi:FAD-binding protein [Streptomyces sp. 1331.2]|uniref:FAD-binding protein n=1 Tax=Streptomyces sp. 1331.2 TaxID=1938835 RepID=UPI000BCB1118|nr:FAD-binding protein [Streptomyces sp. 1331.2]SOB78865.1 FAD/FMN-containing dehydrogenase [Streptomyces sp. 1331.2]